jgi:hypothetical protein
MMSLLACTAAQVMAGQSFAEACRIIARAKPGAKNGIRAAGQGYTNRYQLAEHAALLHCTLLRGGPELA